MNLHIAPFHKNLEIEKIQGLTEDEVLILEQIGLAPGAQIQKVHRAPLGDPLGIKVGEQIFTLRKEVCDSILVKEVH